MTAPIAQIRFARPTDRLAEVVRFYTVGLQLPRIDSFADHDGYDGVMIGLPGVHPHLEFTSHTAGSPCPAPSRDDLLVLYMTDQDAIDAAVRRLQSLEHGPVEPENPYWRDKGVTFEDPDGWRVVLFEGPGLG